MRKCHHCGTAIGHRESPICQRIKQRFEDGYTMQREVFCETCVGPEGRLSNHPVIAGSVRDHAPDSRAFGKHEMGFSE